MIQELDQLKRLIVEFDSDSLQRVAQLENSLLEAIAADDLAEHLTIKEFRKSLESEIRVIDIILTTKYSSDLTDRQRDHLLDKKELYNHFFELFSGQRRAKAEKAIKDTLNNAQSI